MSKKPAAPSKTMVQEVFALAKELGWTSLNDQELRLIKKLRNTTYHGRNLVVETADAMHRAYPWRWDSQGTLFESNTATPFPANDSRFFTKEK